MYFWDQSDLFSWFVEFSNQRYLFFTTIRKGWQRHVSRAPRGDKNKRNPRDEEEEKQHKIPYIWMYEMGNVWKLKTVICQNMHA